MGAGGKKEYLVWEGRPLLAWAVLPFFSFCGSIVITVPAGHAGRVRDLLAPHLEAGRLLLVEGGRTRQESVLRGLESLEDAAPRSVLIHDGARPWLTRDLIERVLDGVARHGACIPVIEAAEAPKRIDGAGFIAEDLSRARTALAQTPQGFLFAPILEAHRRARASGRSCIDDAEVYAAHIAPVFTVAGDRRNRKVTYPEDLERVCGSEWVTTSTG